MEDNEIRVEYQMSSGLWSWFGSVVNHQPNIIDAMQRVQRLYPNCRVRAVDTYGRTVDILT